MSDRLRIDWSGLWTRGWPGRRRLPWEGPVRTLGGGEIPERFLEHDIEPPV